MAFIDLQPLADAELFKQAIAFPIAEGKRAGLTRLRTAMSYVALRRTKNVTDISLPPMEAQLRHVDFYDGTHKELYESLYSTTQAVFESALQEGDDGSLPQQFLFEQLLRVRQACCHGSLIPRSRAEKAHILFAEIAVQGPAFLRTSDGEAAMLALSENDGAGTDSGEVDEFGPSPKIDALLDAIGEMQGDEKACIYRYKLFSNATLSATLTPPHLSHFVFFLLLVFSQWTSFLDIIQQALAASGHSFVRIDGTMTTEQRMEAMAAFSKNEDVRFILCSLQAAGTGISLTRGNVVFMMDPWFNNAVEEQAMQRVHRVGQTRPVRCIRFVMKDSIEERMIKVQQAKAALGKGSMERISRQEERVAKLTAMKDLFELVEDDTNEDYESDSFWKF